MTKVALPPGCYGVELPSGEKYDANNRGVVEVPDKIAPQIKSSTLGAKNLGVLSIAEGRGFGHGIPGTRKCVTCGFEGFKWQKVCPHDGADMEVVEE